MSKTKRTIKKWWIKNFPSAFWKSKDNSEIWFDEIIIYYSLN